MNLSDTAKLLAVMAAFDRRTVGEADVMAWQAVLRDVAYEDAAEAVTNHYGRSSEWLMPAAVRAYVDELDRKRSTGRWAPGQYGVPRDQAHPEITGPLRLEDLPAAVQELLSRLPPGSRAALHPRRAAWEREHRAFLRQQDAKPNPSYDPEAHAKAEEIWMRTEQ